MILNYQEFMRPFLQNAYKAHNNGQVNELKLRNVINQLAEQFNLTDEVHTETQPGGKQSVLENLLAQLIYETSLALLTLKIGRGVLHCRAKEEAALDRVGVDEGT